MQFTEWIARAIARPSRAHLLLASLALVLGACDSSSVVGGTVDSGLDATTMDVPVEITCATGQTTCLGACVDTRASAQHCGACGNACAGGQVCVSGL